MKRKLTGGASHAALLVAFVSLGFGAHASAFVSSRRLFSQAPTGSRNGPTRRCRPGPGTEEFKPLAQPNLVRGEKYGRGNSTLPSPAVIAERLGVAPTKEASSKTWQRAWKTHKRLLPLLHSTDRCKPPDSSLNLACMWWKALAGNDRRSPAYDAGLAYDLLPSGWRNVVRPRRLYPRLHHGNVELRTAYLDRAVLDAAKAARGRGAARGAATRVRLVCMGAGYDTRGVKMLERAAVDAVVELDLPRVVEAKGRLFARLRRRRPRLRATEMPALVPADFNDVHGGLKRTLDAVLDAGTAPGEEDWYTIFVFEGVLIYLDEGVPSALLALTSAALRGRGLAGALCFADRLENVPGGDVDLGVAELEHNGWRMKDWCPKPGLARHMGSAELI